jgi:hypothetical protein
MKIFILGLIFTTSAVAAQNPFYGFNGFYRVVNESCTGKVPNGFPKGLSKLTIRVVKPKARDFDFFIRLKNGLAQRHPVRFINSRKKNHETRTRYSGDGAFSAIISQKTRYRFPNISNERSFELKKGSLGLTLEVNFTQINNATGEASYSYCHYVLK